jgi:hypothetical protein
MAAGRRSVVRGSYSYRDRAAASTTFASANAGWRRLAYHTVYGFAVITPVVIRTLLFAAILAWGSAFAAEAPQRAPERSAAAAEVKSADATAREQEAKFREHQAVFERWMIILTSILGCIAFLQLLAFVAQAVYTRKMLDSTRDTARRQLRAYLGFPDAFIENLGAGRFQIQITVANSGRTRALHVTKWIKAALLDRSENCPFEEQKFDRIQHALAPRSRWRLREDCDWSDDLAAAIQRSDKIVHVWGQVRYTDIYGEPHLSNFRFRSQAARYTNGTIAGWTLEPHEEGNDLS